jgi:general stress protein 26
MSNTNSTDISKLAELIKDIRVAMLTTFPEGEAQAHSRPMYTQTVDPETFDGTLWFMTDAKSGKVHELADNSHVLLTYSAPDKNRYVVVNGTGRAERNPAKARELWNIHAKGWFPDGPTDASLLLIEVRVDSAEYWDGPSNTSYMLSLLKAVVTGQKVQTKSDHGKV